MNAKSRIALILIVLTLLITALVPTVSAGDQFNLLTGNNEFDTMNEHGFVFLNPWKIANKSGDKLDCTEILTAHSGACSFRFKGSASEASKLTQVVEGADLDTLNAFVGDANVAIQMTYQVNSLSTFTKLKAKTIVSVAGSSIKYKSIANFNGTTMFGEFTSWQPVNGTIALVPQDSVVTGVKVMITNKSSKGIAHVDTVAVLFSSN